MFKFRSAARHLVRPVLRVPHLVSLLATRAHSLALHVSRSSRSRSHPNAMASADPTVPSVVQEALSLVPRVYPVGSRPDDPRMDRLFPGGPQYEPSLLCLRGTPTEYLHHIALVGFASDEGTLRNGGRGGSRATPALFREQVKKKGVIHGRPDKSASEIPEGEWAKPTGGMFDLRLHDLGTVGAGGLCVPGECGVCVPGDSGPPRVSLADPLMPLHVELTRRVRVALEAGWVTFSVGGSNDQSFCTAKAMLDEFGADRVAVVNIDAHLDVRPLLEDGRAHSGSPFRLLLEHPGFAGARFAEFGAQREQCSGEHAAYVRSKGGSVHWFDPVAPPASVSAAFRSVLDRIGAPTSTAAGAGAGAGAEVGTVTAASPRIFVSFDADAIRASDMPGVSCPSPFGLTAEDACAIAFAAGQDPRVAAFDLSEINLAIERERSLLLATFIFYSFLRGLAQRPAKSPPSAPPAA